VFIGIIVIYFVLNLILVLVMPPLVLLSMVVFLVIWLYGLYDTYMMAQAKEGKGKYKSPIFG
jgi:hypothetical protein